MVASGVIGFTTGYFVICLLGGACVRLTTIRVRAAHLLLKPCGLSACRSTEMSGTSLTAPYKHASELLTHAHKPISNRKKRHEQEAALQAQSLGFIFEVNVTKFRHGPLRLTDSCCSLGLLRNRRRQPAFARFSSPLAIARCHFAGLSFQGFEAGASWAWCSGQPAVQDSRREVRDLHQIQL